MGGKSSYLNYYGGDVSGEVSVLCHWPREHRQVLRIGATMLENFTVGMVLATHHAYFIAPIAGRVEGLVVGCTKLSILIPNTLVGANLSYKNGYNNLALVYNSKGGIESMAACLRESTARVYFSVWARPLCPRMLATVLMLAPLLSRFVPQL